MQQNNQINKNKQVVLENKFPASEKRIAVVIGMPISHSLSPVIHNYFLKQQNIDGGYSAIAVEPNNLKLTIDRFIAEGYAGFNVTIPYKEKVFSLCQDCSEIARITSAVNTVVIKDGKLFGDNSDGWGFIRGLKQEIPLISLKGRNALLIGAGGASRSIAYSLIKEGCNVVVLNHNVGRALNLLDSLIDTARNFGVKIDADSLDKYQDKLPNIDLLINATPLGMTGYEPLDLDLSLLPQEAIVSDIVYNPLETLLLKRAGARGNKVVGGLNMLANQALVGFRSWFGGNPVVDDSLMELLKGRL